MDMEEHKPITLQCTLKHTGIIQNNGPHSQTILSKKFVLKTNAVFKVDLYSPRQVFLKCYLKKWTDFTVKENQLMNLSWLPLL